jgi:predicted phosphate transport protein (TIGR00153 family)
MFKKFLPKEHKMFSMLAEITSHTLEAANILSEMMDKFEDLGEQAVKIRLIEHKCDDITHAIVNDLNEIFVTPIDREDIHTLVNSLDNVIDSIDVIANRLDLYKVKNRIEFGPELASIVLNQAKILDEVVRKIDDSKDSFAKLVNIRSLETEGDVIFRQAITELFEKEKDVFELIKKKELLEIFEKTADRCQTVAIVIEGILIKNA